MSGYDYGRGGRLGIGTPQANPTVEDELAILLPPTVGRAVARLTSAAADFEDRLRDYLFDLEYTLERFDTLRLDLFVFACTGSSYLVHPDTERRVIATCEARFGMPILTAADAIIGMLDRLGARRIALLSPYPAALADLARDYWRRRGLDVADAGGIAAMAAAADTRGIYALGSDAASTALDAMDLSGIDAVLMSGTGMPSLPVVAAGERLVPIISSNFCLGAAVCARLGLGDLADPSSAIGAGWRRRLADATAHPERSAA